jgi:N-acetylneuraminic acid mutarotase
MRLSFFLLLFSFLIKDNIYAQGSWLQKSNFAGTPRREAIGFSIGTKGYIGTGVDSDSLRSDFWEWDQSTNGWTQKASFSGTARRGAVGFSIGTKGYVGTGQDQDSIRSDFWEWDQTSNTWTQKTRFGGSARLYSVGFSIGTKGYIGTGLDYVSGNGTTKDLWEYDQTTDTWTQKLDLGGSARQLSTAFSIGTKGYILLGGDDQNGSYAADLWEWDQPTNTWTQMSSFPNNGRVSGVSFSI